MLTQRVLRFSCVLPGLWQQHWRQHPCGSTCHCGCQHSTGHCISQPCAVQLVSALPLLHQTPQGRAAATLFTDFAYPCSFLPFLRDHLLCMFMCSPYKRPRTPWTPRNPCRTNSLTQWQTGQTMGLVLYSPSSRERKQLAHRRGRAESAAKHQAIHRR